MKVYVLRRITYDNACVVGIFLHELAAINWRNEICKKESDMCNWDIEEHTVDEAEE